MIKHRHPEIGFEWWVPPGGGLEGDETLFQCAIRETREETGIEVELDRVVYLREFLEAESNRHNLEVFLLASSYRGEMSLKNLRPGDPDQYVIREVRFLSQAEMQGQTVFPEVLKDQFWKDLVAGTLSLKYLGQQLG